MQPFALGFVTHGITIYYSSEKELVLKLCLMVCLLLILLSLTQDLSMSLHFTGVLSSCGMWTDQMLSRFLEGGK